MTKAGEPKAFFFDLMSKDHGDECITWPFAKMGTDGKGFAEIRDAGVAKRVGVLICEALYGPRPSTRHLAVARCGHGADGCCNPKHFFWGTWEDLHPIRVAAGTSNRGEQNGRHVLTTEQALLIREMAPLYFDAELGQFFGVSRQTVARIRKGTHWKHLWEGQAAA